MLNKIFLLLALTLTMASCQTAKKSLLQPEDQAKLKALQERAVEKRKYSIGYPVNQNTGMQAFYEWYLQSGLYNVSMNNVGNPQKESPYSLNTHEEEREVISYFAKLLNFGKDQEWGIVTYSGTDGNNHGVYYGKKYLQSKSKLAPIVYVSEEAHYSIKKLADLQGIELRLIKANEMGVMDLAQFKKQFDKKRPALVVLAYGTTFKGAIDPVSEVIEYVQQQKPPAYYFHVDAALFGGYLAYVDNVQKIKELDYLMQEKTGYHSIAISGHKYFGFDEPMGIFITTKDILTHLNPFHVPYLNDAVPTITCSRSALGALKFWWKIKTTSVADFKNASKQMLENATYLHSLLQKKSVKAWVQPLSNTVFFERPSAAVLKKYDLAIDESPTLGKLAHLIVMPHVTRELLEQFAQEYQK